MSASALPPIDRAFVARQSVIRRAMLAELYARAVLDDVRTQAFERDLTHALGHAPDECVFALNYLIATGCVIRSGTSCRISARGIDQFEHLEQELP